MIQSSNDLICVFCGKTGFKKQMIVNYMGREQEVVKCNNCGKFMTNPQLICTNYNNESIIEDWTYLPKEEPKYDEPDVEVDVDFDEEGNVTIKEIRAKDKEKAKKVFDKMAKENRRRK